MPAWMTGLAARFRLIQLDMRGRGLSGRGLNQDFIYTDYELDLAAVVDGLGLERFILFTVGGFGHSAVRYAVAHPERVEALVLNNWPVSIPSLPAELMQGVSAENWGYFVRRMMPPALQAEAAREWLDRWLNRVSYEDWQIAALATSLSSIERDLPQLRVPTLVVHSRDFPMFGPDESIKLAASFPNARLVLIDGNVMDSDATEGLAAVDAFLAETSGLLPHTPVSLGPVGNETVVASGGLSRRQSEVLRLIAEGRTTREIADALVLSERTVERQIADVYAKIGVRNRSEATAFALGQPGD